MADQPGQNSQAGCVMINAQDLQLAAYAALRSELEKRLELRQQLLLATLAVAGTFLTLGVQPGLSALTVLVYPLLAMFIAVIDAHSDLRIGQIAYYLRELEESILGAGFGWEAYRRRTFTGTHPLAAAKAGHQLSMRGVYTTTQLLARGLGAVRAFPLMDSITGGLTAGIALSLALAATLYTAYLAQHRR
jgi:hypothetical protein